MSVWTDNKPTEPGWYWYQHPRDTRPEPLYVHKRPGHEYLCVQEESHPQGPRSFIPVARMNGKWAKLEQPTDA